MWLREVLTYFQMLEQLFQMLTIVVRTSRTQVELNLGSNLHSSHLVPCSASSLTSQFPLHGSVDLLGWVPFRLMEVGTIWRPFQQAFSSTVCFMRTREWVFEVEINTQMVENEQLRECRKSWGVIRSNMKPFGESFFFPHRKPPHWYPRPFLRFSLVSSLSLLCSCGILKALLFSLLQQRRHGPVIIVDPSAGFFWPVGVCNNAMTYCFTSHQSYIHHNNVCFWLLFPSIENPVTTNVMSCLMSRVLRLSGLIFSTTPLCYIRILSINSVGVFIWCTWLLPCQNDKHQ